jgi:GR25 family glycosyltransferase involved in LPS biosynthesis
MKTVLIVICSIFLSLSLKSQNADTISTFNDDYILKKLIPAIPMGWNIIKTDSEIIIKRKDSIFIADRRKLNIPMFKKISDDTILKYGTKSAGKIILRYENRWTEEQKINAKSNNIQIYQQMSKLPGKYNIYNLKDKTKSTKQETVYTGNTDKEKELIKQFENEKNELVAKLINFPKYNTEKYSLFLKSTIGCDDEYISVYPSSASIELYNILTLFFELTEKVE